MSGARIIAFGDIVDDIVVVPHGAIRADTDTTSTIRPRPGGSAANTAAWLGALGAPVDFVGSAGAADVERHAALLRAHGVEPHLTPHPELPTSTIVIVVDGEHRTMLTERGANAALAQEQVTDKLLAAAGVLHVTGYTLFDGPRAAGVQRLIARAHAAGVTVALNPGSAGYIADFGVDAFLAGIAGVDILLANAAEGALLTGAEQPGDIAQLLAESHGLAVLTRGAAPVVVAARGGIPVEVRVPAVQVVDPTGAGDAMAAGFLHGWLRGGDPVRAAEDGIRLAAQAVTRVGGRPA